MTTTNNANPSKLPPQPALSNANAGDGTASELLTVFFRQSADGTNFFVTPVLLHPADARAAVSGHPGEYSTDGVTFAAWPGGNNSAQKVGGRGRLLGASVASD